MIFKLLEVYGPSDQIQKTLPVINYIKSIQIIYQIVSERHAAGREMCLWGFIGSHQHFIFTGLIV